MREGTGWIALLAASTLRGQLPVEWYAATNVTPRPRTAFAMVHDVVRDRAVLFGGADQDWLAYPPEFYGDTWEWIGRWAPRPSAIAPSPRTGHAMAYDRIRQRVALTGGWFQAYPPKFNPPVFHGDTWEWDGMAWQQLPATLPPRTAHVMTWHAGIGRLLVFGGRSAGGARSDTLSLNGGQWQPLAGNGPPAGSGMAGAYDEARGRWVVFGGAATDAWEFDGANWHQRIASPAPSQRVGAAMAWDPVRRRTVLQGGTISFLYASNELWEWDGTAWQLMTAALPRRTGHQAAWHGSSGKVLFYGGQVTGLAPIVDGTMRSWDGATWRLESETARGNWLAAFGSLLVSAGSQGVFDWVENRWRRIGPPPPATSLSQPDAVSLVEDTVRNRLMLIDTASRLVQEYDGASWHGPFACPFPARGRASVAFDRVRGVAVVFGGASTSTSTILGDAWEWDGSLWRAASAPTMPSARWDAAMGFEPILGGLLLHGGFRVGGYLLADTWLLRAGTWQQLPTATSPMAWGRLALHEAEGRLYLGGQGLWQWTGTDWLQILPTSVYAPLDTYDRGTARLAALQADGQVRYFGPHAVPAMTRSGTGCAHGAATPRLIATSPFLGNPQLVIDVMDAPPQSLGVLALATQSAAVPIAGGCKLLVGGTVGSTFLAVDGNGFATAAKRIPRDAALRGATFHVQVVLLHVPGGALAATSRLSLTLGD